MTKTVKKFEKRLLQGLVYDDNLTDEEYDRYKVVKQEIIDTSRWSNIYEMVFHDIIEGKYYYTSYSSGATEQQDESPFEYDPDEIKCIEVKPVEVTKIEYREVLK